MEKEAKPLPGKNRFKKKKIVFINTWLFSGLLARKPTAVIPKRFIKGGYDDATSVFTPGRWERMPVGPPEKWWHELPLKWPELMPEYGAKVKTESLCK